jgi:hypothetical protein
MSGFIYSCATIVEECCAVDTFAIPPRQVHQWKFWSFERNQWNVPRTRNICVPGVSPVWDLSPVTCLVCLIQMPQLKANTFFIEDLKLVKISPIGSTLTTIPSNLHVHHMSIKIQNALQVPSLSFSTLNNATLLHQPLKTSAHPLLNN